MSRSTAGRLRAALSLPPSATVLYGPSERPKEWKIQEFGQPARYWPPSVVASFLADQPRQPRGGRTHGIPGGARPAKTGVVIYLDAAPLADLDARRGDQSRAACLLAESGVNLRLIEIASAALALVESVDGACPACVDRGGAHDAGCPFGRLKAALKG